MNGSYEDATKILLEYMEEGSEKYFESVITYFSSKGIKYDEITLRPLFSIIVKEKDLDENTILNNFVNCKIIEVSNYDLIGEINHEN